MEQTGTASTSHSAADFAGILTALTRPAPKPEPAWNDDDLAEDVATLSYESALKAHERYESLPEREPRARTEAAPGAEDGPEEIWDEPALETGPAVETIKTKPRPEPKAEATRTPLQASATPTQQSRKCASITIRMSQAECEQLRRRAAEAGMTISAYLRSCTFEAESLRAQVKQALAEMKQASTAAKPVQPAEAPQERATRSGWLRRLVPGRPLPPRAA